MPVPVSLTLQQMNSPTRASGRATTWASVSVIRSVVINNVSDETHTGPHNPSSPVQSFDTVMYFLQGQLPPGDPDFDLLRVTAGTGFGLPSPGHTTLTALGGGNYNVDSFFDITYRIDFVGHAGGPFGGMSGSTTGTIRMSIGEPVPEPGTWMLLGTGVLGVIGLRLRRRR